MPARSRELSRFRARRRRCGYAWTVKSSLLLRALRARWDQDPNVKQEATGWGLNVSGCRPMLRWDSRDSLSLQFSYGDGYGRYVNDLGSIGGQDAVFDDATGEMKSLKALAPREREPDLVSGAANRRRRRAAVGAARGQGRQQRRRVAGADFRALSVPAACNSRIIRS
jgi:hypothetical protein